MYSVTVSSIPRSCERRKDADPQRANLWGADIAKEGLVRSLLEHGRFDHVFMPCPTRQHADEARRRLASYPNRERVQLIPLGEFHTLSGRDRMVLFHPGGTGGDGVRDPGLARMVNLRAFVRRPDWPITGVTHSISGHAGSWLHFESVMNSLSGHDALICTSNAGRLAVEQIVARLPVQSSSGMDLPHERAVRLPVIPLGTDTVTFQPRDRAEARARLGLPGGPVIFLYFGRFASHYKADLFPLILAFSEIPEERRQRAYLLLAGDDSIFRLSPDLDRFAALLGISAQVGVRPNPTSFDKAALYNAADVFVSPIDSVQETFGQTLIEAMASGLPVIASDWSGYRDTVLHGTTGFLLPTYWANCFDHLRDTPFLHDVVDLYTQLGQGAAVDLNALRRFMQLMIDDDTLRRGMGEAARATAQTKYSWPVIIGQLEELWLELLDSKARQRTDVSQGAMAFDYVDTFRHHPTKLMTADSTVTLSVSGSALLGDPARLHIFAPTELSGVSDDIWRIVSACRPGECMTVSELLSRVGPRDETLRRNDFQHIARMVKYGLLELKPHRDGDDTSNRV